MNDPFSGALIIAAVSACGGFAWSWRRRVSYFLASLTLLSLATFCGIVVASRSGWQYLADQNSTRDSKQRSEC